MDFPFGPKAIGKWKIIISLRIIHPQTRYKGRKEKACKDLNKKKHPGKHTKLLSRTRKLNVVQQLDEHRLEIITLLSAINLKRRSLSLGNRPQHSKENNGPVAAERFDRT